MKVFITLLAIVALAKAGVLTDDKADAAQALKYVECVVKAITEGVPSIPVPKHNPTKISNLTIKNTEGLITYEMGLTNSYLYNLLDYTFPVLTAKRVDANRVVYKYELDWKKLNISGDIKLLWKAPLINVDETTTYSVVINNLRWSGTFDFTKPVKGTKGKVNVFSINSKSTSVDVSLNFPASYPIEKTISLAIWEVFNHFPELITETFRTVRFNDFWLGHPDRINAVLDVCGFEHIPTD